MIGLSTIGLSGSVRPGLYGSNLTSLVSDSGLDVLFITPIAMPDVMVAISSSVMIIRKPMVSGLLDDFLAICAPLLKIVYYLAVAPFNNCGRPSSCAGLPRLIGFNACWFSLGSLFLLALAIVASTFNAFRIIIVVMLGLVQLALLSVLL